MTELDRRDEVVESGVLGNLLEAIPTPKITVVENHMPEIKFTTQHMSTPQIEENQGESEPLPQSVNGAQDTQGKTKTEGENSQTHMDNTLTRESSQLQHGDITTQVDTTPISPDETFDGTAVETTPVDTTPISPDETLDGTAAKTTPVDTAPISPDETLDGTAAETTKAKGSAKNKGEHGASFTPVKENGTRPRRLKELQIGMELQGRVTSVALYGIFVDLGVGRDGLVHISEMSDNHIDSPADLVQIGDTVNVRVKSIDLDARRISLTMRSQRNGGEQKQEEAKEAEVDYEALAKLKVGDIVRGTITGLAPFGAFVDIGIGKDGLVHISELSEKRVDKPEDAVQVNHQYNFKLLDVDSDGNRISLSLRRAQRSLKMQQLSPGDIIQGTISGLAPFGAFVDIGVGRDGLVHISQMSHNRVGKVEDIVKLGETISVRVLEVDSQSKRISLTMRSEDPPKEETAKSAEQSASVHASSSNTESSSPPSFQRGEWRRPEGRESRRPDSKENRRPDSKESRRPDSKESRRPDSKESRRPDSKENRRPDSKENRRPDSKEGRQRGNKESRRPATQSQPVELISYAIADDVTDDEFEGNATLEDLLTKFGNPNTNRRDRRRRIEEDDDDDDERFAYRQRQRDAIRRTLQRIDDDD